MRLCKRWSKTRDNLKVKSKLFVDSSWSKIVLIKVMMLYSKKKLKTYSKKTGMLKIPLTLYLEKKMKNCLSKMIPRLRVK